MFDKEQKNVIFHPISCNDVPKKHIIKDNKTRHSLLSEYRKLTMLIFDSFQRFKFSNGIII